MFTDKFVTELENPGIARIGRDLKAHLIPTPCHGQGHLPLDQVLQAPSNLVFDTFREEYDKHLFSKKPALYFFLLLYELNLLIETVLL